MSANDDSNLPEVEKIPLVIDAEFTEEDSAMVNSTRIRVGRNCHGYPLGPGVSKE